MNYIESSAGDALQYMANVYGKGLEYEKPPFTFHSTEWEGLARDRMSKNSLGYVCGNASTGETDRKNRAAFQKWSIVPRRLVKTTTFPSLETHLLGQTLPVPIAIAPVGVQRIFNPDGEIASAAAAASENVPYIFSSASASTLEDVAKANGNGTRWFQLYWPGNEHNDLTASILKRAKANGFSTLFVTLDTYKLGWRPSDLDNAYNPFLRPDSIGAALGYSDPVFRRQFKEKHGKEIEEDLQNAAKEWITRIFPDFSHGWEDLAFLRKHWDGPIVLKGIQSVQDAKMAVEHGMDGIVVSNHGGRQQDGGPASIDCLERISKAVGSKIDLLFDSGVRCGSDIAKALALGAKMVLIGRPYVYGLVLGGQDGVSHVLRSLLGELTMDLHLGGIPSISEKHLNIDCLEYSECKS
ncbi:LANO_0C09318g1_1 [Lachancea nothofagi CBS 11611]|uniref:LANO_0C09318g1_1 n=1 Tax=Lachancea nothofagi CBS 11611 TaxID=1266666 RepID=A0A1G4J9X7_9SACH|nr:LANO_0C09318g1_1 [Lachancea nothofagi CBS 11611]